MKKTNIFNLAVFTASIMLLGAGCTASSPSSLSPTPTPSPVSSAPLETTNPTPEPTPTPTPTSPTPVVKKPATPVVGKAVYYGVAGVDSVGSMTSGYVATAKVYKDSGFYYQFVNCHGSPGILTVKEGTKFMLDNRDKTGHRVVLGDATYNLPGYGYIIATAPHLIGTQHLVCDGGGAALLTVQK